MDGADEIGPGLCLIKGGGGALLREKIVAAASARMIVIADQSKRVSALGQFPLPIEVVSFGLAATQRAVEKAIGLIQRPGPMTLRKGKEGHAFVTDGGHWILDAALGRIDDPAALAHGLSDVPGVVEHGLFIGLAHMAIVGGPNGLEDRRKVLKSRARWSFQMSVVEVFRGAVRPALVAVALVAHWVLSPMPSRHR